MTGQGFTPEAGLDTSSAYARDFQRESWTLYGVGIAVIFLRRYGVLSYRRKSASLHIVLTGVVA